MEVAPELRSVWSIDFGVMTGFTHLRGINRVKVFSVWTRWKHCLDNTGWVSYQRNDASMLAESSLDGIYILRTSAKAESLATAEVGASLQEFKPG